MIGSRSKSDDTLPPLRYDLAARAEAQAATGGAWSLRHLWICWPALVGAGLVLGLIAGLVTGTAGVLGVLIGTGIVGIFFTLSAVVLAWVGARWPKKLMWTAVGTYLAKMIALGFVLVLIPRDGDINTRWMAGAVGIGLAAWLAAHLRFVWTNKILYVDPV